MSNRNRSFNADPNKAKDRARELDGQPVEKRIKPDEKKAKQKKK